MKQLTLQAKRLLPFCLFSFLLLFSGCGGDDELSMPEVIVGTWTVDNYEVLGDDTEYTVYIDRFEFRKDQTFTVYYGLAPGQDVVDDPDTGRYEAGKDYLRLEYDNPQGEEQRVLCEILSFTESTIDLIYRHPDSDIQVKIFVKKK